MHPLLRFVAVLLGLSAIGALVVLPNVVHVLDHGTASISADAADPASLTSRNVQLTGFPHLEVAVRQTVTREDSQSSPEISMYYPVVGQGWAPGQPVRFVAQAWGYDLNEAIGATGEGRPVTHVGTVRDVLWEGMPSDVPRLFEEQGVTLAPDAVLVELRGAHSTSDRLRAYGAPLLGLLLGLIVAGQLKREQSGPPPSGPA